ncbi:MAG: NrsF family protein [Pseudolabrys sp.]|nr:NrsF family protein [Pseudolabrys sp.]MDP2299044.1 NrsF family protein [Pseudolabrys sp.]
MRTDELVHALVADRAAVQAPLGRQVALAIAIGFAISAGLFWMALGPRPDIAAAAVTVRFDLKITQALLLATTAVALVLRLAQPGADTGLQKAVLAAAPILLIVAVVAELLIVPASQWQAKMIGSNALICLTVIPLLSLPLLAALLLVLRRGAPTSRAAAGAVAGLVAGGLGAALYATHCTDDSPLFVAVWYSIAIGGVTVLGAALGRSVLRW